MLRTIILNAPASPPTLPLAPIPVQMFAYVFLLAYWGGCYATTPHTGTPSLRTHHLHDASKNQCEGYDIPIIIRCIPFLLECFHGTPSLCHCVFQQSIHGYPIHPKHLTASCVSLCSTLLLRCKQHPCKSKTYSYCLTEIH